MSRKQSSADEVADQARDLLGGEPVTRVTRVTTGIPVTRVTGYSAFDLLRTDFPAAKWSVPGLIPEGLGILAGRPKKGKSWLALGCGIAIAAGGTAFGRIEVQKGDVLYLALEDGPRRLKNRLTTILGEADGPKGLRLEMEWPRGNEGVQRIERWLADHQGARLVVIDTLAKFRSEANGRESAYSADYAALVPLQQLATDQGVAIVVLHHERKMNASDWVDQISGTLGLSGAADTLMALHRERGSDKARFMFTGRDVDDGVIPLTFDRTTCTWHFDPHEKAEFAGLSDERRQIVTAIQEHGPMTPRQAAPVLGKSEGAVKKLMWTMSQQGQLTVEKGIYGLEMPGSGNSGNRGNPVTQGPDSNTKLALISVTEPVTETGNPVTRGPSEVAHERTVHHGKVAPWHPGADGHLVCGWCHPPVAEEPTSPPGGADR